MRARSPETEIRRLRAVLRNARSALQVNLDGSATDPFKRSIATEVVRLIDRTLKPKSPRHEAWLARRRRA